uniref:Uncharacterized protein n=1 Tax=Anguilla anguilla TaxID=7936 RepID=A0A0E9VZ76_ANGAN
MYIKCTHPLAHSYTLIDIYAHEYTCIHTHTYLNMHINTNIHSQGCELFRPFRKIHRNNYYYYFHLLVFKGVVIV